MLFPGKFTPKRASKFEDGVALWAPPQLLALVMFGIFIPGGLCEYALFNGHAVWGAVGLLMLIPALWLFLVEIHDLGRVRSWLSAPVVLIGHVVMGVWFAGRVL